MPQSEKPPYSRNYFLSEIHRFRKMMGTKSFWNNKTPGKAMEGLLYVYTNTNDTLTDADINFMTMTTEEYDRRLQHVFFGV